MFVKIFKPKASFSGVKYNTRKVDGNRGELMKVANFGPLQAFGHLKPQDYINYLSSLAALNSRVQLPQFHAVISGKGRSYSKEALTEIAEQWLREMGYGSQPYLIVFHHDTENNHVHLVSSRVDHSGCKISSAYEHKRAQRGLNKVLGYEFAMQYKFSTRAQLMMVLESRGYPGIDPDEKQISERIAGRQLDKQRIAELRSLFSEFKGRRDLPAFLKDRYRIELVFHASEGKKAYGYSIIDHETKQVFKGSEVMPLREIGWPEASASTHDDVPADERTEAAEAYIQPVSIADDVDDQQIHGMRRRRQKKSRTNTR